MRTAELRESWRVTLPQEPVLTFRGWLRQRCLVLGQLKKEYLEPAWPQCNIQGWQKILCFTTVIKGHLTHGKKIHLGFNELFQTWSSGSHCTLKQRLAKTSQGSPRGASCHFVYKDVKKETRKQAWHPVTSCGPLASSSIFFSPGFLICNMRMIT